MPECAVFQVLLSAK